MKTWLKGGLILAIIGIIFFWLLMINSSLKWGLWRCSTIVDSIDCSFFEFIISPVHWITAIFFGIIGGTIGAFIGWLIGRSKK